jgi:hypothetical protein
VLQRRVRGGKFLVFFIKLFSLNFCDKMFSINNIQKFPASEVGYTSATTRRETTKSMTDMWWHWKTTTFRNKFLEILNNI